MILIDSLYINNSGGLVLLNYLVEELEKASLKPYYVFDARNPTSYGISKDRIQHLTPSVTKRKKLYQNLPDNVSHILCFGNIPPPISLPNTLVFTYVHQYFYLNLSTSDKGRKDRVAFKLKQLFLKLSAKNSDYFLVQSAHMKDEFELKYPGNEVRVVPFYPPPANCHAITRVANFVYISNGNPHKNHMRLLNAWRQVHKSFPNVWLYLTVDSQRYPSLGQQIASLEKENIQNLGIISKHEVCEQLGKNKFLIYPSLAESFGLVLIEAVTNEIKVIAADMPYVNSVIEPSLSFDPYSEKSIANAITQALNTELTPSKIRTRNQIDELIKMIA